MSTSTKSNFGSKGWLMIFVAGLMFYFYAGMCTDGLNTVVSSFAQLHGVDEGALLSWTTPASWLGLVGAALSSWLITRRGNRIIMFISALLGGVTYMCYGLVSSLAGFTVVTALPEVKSPERSTPWLEMRLRLISTLELPSTTTPAPQPLKSSPPAPLKRIRAFDMV